MSRQHHYLKTETEFFQDIERGKKKFELRKNDRDFQVYDMVVLLEVVKGVPTGRESGQFEIQYVFQGGKYGLDEEYCIFCW